MARRSGFKVAIIAALVAAAIAPGTQAGHTATHLYELHNFDSDTVGFAPSVSWATIATDGYVFTDQFVSGTKSLKAVNGVKHTIDVAAGICDGAAFSFALRLAELPSTSSTRFMAGFAGGTAPSNADSNPFVGFRVGETAVTGATYAIANGATPAPTDVAVAFSPGLSWTIDTWYTVTISVEERDNEAGCGDDEDASDIDGDMDDRVNIVIQSPTTTHVARAAFTSDFLTDSSTFYTQQETSGNNIDAYWIDDLGYSYTVAPTITWAKEPTFCSIRGNTDFAYMYAEDVIRGENADTIPDTSEMSGVYTFQGDATNYAYAGKGITDTLGAKVYFHIEARTENVDSVFRAVFSFEDDAAWIVGSGETATYSDDAKGNGIDSGAFNKAVEVRFLEVDNDWNIQLFYTNDGGTRTKIGGALLVDNPNTPTGYVFHVRTDNGQAKMGISHANGGELTNGLLTEVNLGAVAPTFIGDAIQAQWFVGYAADNIVNADGFTFIDDDDDSGTPSTCVYTLETVAGSGQGATPIGDPGGSGPLLNETTGVPETLTPDDGIRDPDPADVVDPGTAAEAGVSDLFADGVDGVAIAVGIPVTFAALIFGLFGMVLTVAIFAVPTAVFVAQTKMRGGMILVVLVGWLAGTVGMIAYYSFGLLPGWVVSLYVALLLAIAIVGVAVLRR